MSPPPRGVKRAHFPKDAPRDIDIPFGDSTLVAGDVKREYESLRSDVIGFSHNPPGSTAQSPDGPVTVPPIPQPSRSQYADPSVQNHPSMYPSHQPTISRQTPHSLDPLSGNDQTDKSSRHSLYTKTASTTSRNPSNSAFRNVSACNRCRLRKNRCDQQLPACRSCEKAGVKCVGFDPFMGREVPRSYVHYLESRAVYLENLLRENGVEYISAERFALEKQPEDERLAKGDARQVQREPRAGAGVDGLQRAGQQQRQVQKEQRKDMLEEKKLDTLVSNIGLVTVQGASDPRYLGTTSGITFARVVFAAVKSTVSRAPSDMGGVRPGKVTFGAAAAAGGSSMRDSVFGLQTKPTFKGAPFPDKELGLKLINLYFEHANPQLPILHRGEFMVLFEKVYNSKDHQQTPRESYLLNIVFAIGAGIILDSSGTDRETPFGGSNASAKGGRPPPKRARLSNQQHQPEEYHSSAIVHLENFLDSSPVEDQAGGLSSGLEELQAVLLLAGFALLRPVAPGLWYIVGVAMRLAVDLGLHHEDVSDAVSSETTGNLINNFGSTKDEPGSGNSDMRETGRRQWVRDLRRRLWWSVYSLDRLVSSCVGRPFGITDQVVTTDFPSLLDDRYITTAGFSESPSQPLTPSAKFVSHHYFRLRLLQSEILQVLQYQYAQRVHATKNVEPNKYMYTKLQSPFLANFSSFRLWRTDVDRRLWEWKESAPSQQDAGVQFSPLFFELNYWQAVIMLYRQGLMTPAALAHEVTSLDDAIDSPEHRHVEDEGDEEFVYLKIAEAGQRVLKLYRQLHRVHLVNYTFLATHHLFMAGISFLYAIWHSAAVRSHLSLDDVDFTVLAATSVLTDLIDKCPPAEACKDAFDRMSKATISMCMSTTGFGPEAIKHEKKAAKPSRSRRDPIGKSGLGRIRSHPSIQIDASARTASSVRQQGRSSPQFDMNLKDLFSEDETKSQILNRPSNSALGYWVLQQQQQQQQQPLISAEVHNLQASNNVFSQHSRRDSGDGMENMNIDPLLQQASPQSEVPQLSSQAGHSSGFAVSQQQLQHTAFPPPPEFDTWFLDSFAPGSDELPGSELNGDLYGVGGMDGDVDLFNGFFFGNGSTVQGLHGSGFVPS